MILNTRMYDDRLVISGNGASTSTRNESAQNESLNRSSGTRRARSEPPNDESRYKDETGILFFCLFGKMYIILSFGQVTRTNGELLMKMDGMKKKKMKMRTKRYLIA